MNKWEMPMVKAVDDKWIDWTDGGSDAVDQIR